MRKKEGTEQSMIQGLYCVDDEPMLETTSAFDSLQIDSTSKSHPVETNFAATPRNGGIQRVHTSISSEPLLQGIIQAGDDVEIGKRERCDSLQSMQSENLTKYLALLVVKPKPTTVKRKTAHRRSKYTLVGFGFLVNENKRAPTPTDEYRRVDLL